MKIFALILLVALSLPSFAQEQQSQTAQEPEAADIPAETPAQLEPAPAPRAVPEKPSKTDADLPLFDSEVKWVDQPLAKLQGLNKITAKTSVIPVKIGETVKFGNLDVTVSKCVSKPESEKNESLVLLEIWDKIPGQTRNQVFDGWMFSASPAISALEHPIYDVILLECTSPKKAAQAKTDKVESAK